MAEDEGSTTRTGVVQVTVPMSVEEVLCPSISRTFPANRATGATKLATTVPPMHESLFRPTPIGPMLCMVNLLGTCNQGNVGMMTSPGPILFEDYQQQQG